MTIQTEINYQQLYDDISSHPKAQTISYGISDQYVQHWSETNSLIEYIANFYDENGLDFEIIKKQNAVILKDKSKRGIKLEDLAFGNSESRHLTTKIGEKGEGFKLGTIPLLRDDKRVLLDTIGHTIVFYFEYDKELQSNVLKSKVIPNDRKEGTTAYLETNKLNDASKRFLFLNKGLTKISDLLYKPEKDNKNYIFVNTFGGQKINSYFSYSIHKKQKVNRDRNIIENAHMDILLSLFGTQDENVIKEWILSFSNPGFDYSFENELLKFFIHNKHRKELKNLDFSLWRKVAKENNIVFIPYALEQNERKRLKYVSPNSHFISKVNNFVELFCKDFLKNEVDINSFPLAKVIDGVIHFPIVEYSHRKVHKDIELIEGLIDELTSLKSLKSAVKKGNTLTYTLNDKKVDYLYGKVEGLKKDFKSTVNQVFYYLYKLSANYSFSGWDFSFIEEDLPIITFKENPKLLSFQITNKDLSLELDKNILFIDKKVILKDMVYKLPNNQHIISQGLLDKTINSLFSYDMKVLKYGSYYLGEILTSPRVVKPILKSIKEGNIKRLEYEISLINQFLLSDNFSSWETKKIKEVWTKCFIETYSPQSYISTTTEMDKKLEYNRFEVVLLPSVIQQFFVKFGIRKPPSSIGTNVKVEGVLPKPSFLEYDEFKLSPYHQVFTNLVILSKTLEEVFLITKDYPSDKRERFLTKLLPFHSHENKIASIRNGNYLTKSTYRKTIREYCFKIYNKTFICDFDRETINGLQGKDEIYLGYEFGNGTLFHEYIHLSSGLRDIDKEFEKMLSFLGIMALKQMKSLTDNEVKKIYNLYLKFE